jgi:hypothetical protein
LTSSGGPDALGSIGETHMTGVLIGIGVHGHGFDAEPLGGADDATGDLAAVCDEQAPG